MQPRLCYICSRNRDSKILLPKVCFHLQ